MVSTAQSLPSGFEAASDALQARFFKDYPSGQANGRIKLSLNLSYDTRDSGLLATRGTSVSLGLGYGYSAPQLGWQPGNQRPVEGLPPAARSTALFQ